MHNGDIHPMGRQAAVLPSATTPAGAQVNVTGPIAQNRTSTVPTGGATTSSATLEKFLDQDRACGDFYGQDFWNELPSLEDIESFLEYGEPGTEDPTGLPLRPDGQFADLLEASQAVPQQPSPLPLEDFSPRMPSSTTWPPSISASSVLTPLERSLPVNNRPAPSHEREKKSRMAEGKSRSTGYLLSQTQQPFGPKTGSQAIPRIYTSRLKLSHPSVQPPPPSLRIVHTSPQLFGQPDTPSNRKRSAKINTLRPLYPPLDIPLREKGVGFLAEWQAQYAHAMKSPTNISEKIRDNLRSYSYENAGRKEVLKVSHARSTPLEKLLSREHRQHLENALNALLANESRTILKGSKRIFIYSILKHIDAFLVKKLFHEKPTETATDVGDPVQICVQTGFPMNRMVLRANISGKDLKEHYSEVNTASLLPDGKVITVYCYCELRMDTYKDRKGNEVCPRPRWIPCDLIIEANVSTSSSTSATPNPPTIQTTSFPSLHDERQHAPDISGRVHGSSEQATSAPPNTARVFPRHNVTPAREKRTIFEANETNTAKKAKRAGEN